MAAAGVSDVLHGGPFVPSEAHWATALASQLASGLVDAADCSEDAFRAIGLLVEAPDGEPALLMTALRAMGSSLRSSPLEQRRCRVMTNLLMARVYRRLAYHEQAFRIAYGELYFVASELGGVPALQRRLRSFGTDPGAELGVAALEVYGSSVSHANLSATTRASCIQFGRELLGAYVTNGRPTVYPRAAQMAAEWLRVCGPDDPQLAPGLRYLVLTATDPATLDAGRPQLSAVGRAET
jgi:hypothetical protein